MSALPIDVLERILRRTCGWDEVDVAQEVEHRRTLRAASLVCRRFAVAAAAVLYVTIVTRRLGDFDAVERAAGSGVLRLDRVRSFVLDEGPCAAMDSVELAWLALERERGGSVSRADEANRALHEIRVDAGRTAALVLFSKRAMSLARRLPRLIVVRSAFSRTFTRLREPWPMSRLAIASLRDIETHLWPEYQDADVGLWNMDVGEALTALSLLGGFYPFVLPPLPVPLCRQLEYLRVGALEDPPEGESPDRNGFYLETFLFAGPTPALRSLDVRSGSLPAGLAGRPGSTCIFGHAGEPTYQGPVKRLHIGLDVDGVEAQEVGSLVATLPADTGVLSISVVSVTEMYTYNLADGFDAITALGVALLDQRNAVGLAQLNLDLSGFGQFEVVWRAIAQWRALEEACEARGIDLVVEFGRTPRLH